MVNFTLLTMLFVTDWMKHIYKRINKCKDWKELERLAGLYLLSGGIRCQLEYYNFNKGFLALI